MRKTKAFTLVELLVVIGIIALLISILLPTLNRARESANLLKCQANFRQVYSSVIMYSADNKGLLPRTSWYLDVKAGQTLDPNGTLSRTFKDLTKYLARTLFAQTPRQAVIDDENLKKLSTIFTCTQALDPLAQQGNQFSWAPNMVRTVVFNPRAFPCYDQQDPTLFTVDGIPMPTEYPQRKLVSIKNQSEKLMAWDGAQLITWNYCSQPGVINVDNWNWDHGHRYTDPPADGDYTRWNSQVFPGPIPNPVPQLPPNRDGDWHQCPIRYRHVKNQYTPVVFFDGHVESRKIGSIKVREICINR